MSQTEVQLIKDAVIVNADVSNSAAIDVSKLSGVMPLAGGSFTDDVTFTGASANIVFDKSDNALEFADNAKATFGTGEDLQISHDSTNSTINSQTGNLRIRNAGTLSITKGSSENMALFIPDGAVELYHDNSKKFETTSGGVEVFGVLQMDDGNSHIKLIDGARIDIGSSADLQIYHSGGENFIRGNASTSTLFIDTCNELQIRHLDTNGSNSEKMIVCNDDGAVELYHDNSKKLDTDSEGISVTGTVKINNTSAVGNYNGGADDMLIGTHSGNHGLTILSGTSNGGFIMFSDNNGGGINAYRGQIEYAHSTDSMRFITDSGERVRILSGGGITFNGDTAAANALDDYEEGTFTPDWRGGSALGTTSYGTTNSASYTKIGRMVTVTGRTDITGSSGGAGFWFCTNMPFNVNSGGKGFNAVGSVSLENTNFANDTTYVIATMEQNNNNMHIHTVRDDASLGTGVSPSNGAMTVQWTITYQTA